MYTYYNIIITIPPKFMKAITVNTYIYITIHLVIECYITIARVEGSQVDDVYIHCCHVLIMSLLSISTHFWRPQYNFAHCNPSLF